MSQGKKKKKRGLFEEEEKKEVARCMVECLVTF